MKIMDAEIFPNFSFVTVPFAQAEALLEIFKNKKRGRKPFVEIAQKSKGKNSKNTSETRSMNSTNNTGDLKYKKRNYPSH